MLSPSPGLRANAVLILPWMSGTLMTIQKGCKCPPGFRGDGVHSCEDIDECKEKLACQCPKCKCKNTWGSYECKCSSGLFYMQENDMCIGKYTALVSSGGFIWMIIFVIAVAGAGGYAFYKYRIQRYMDSEIRAIMAQYMPLDNQPETSNQVHHDIQKILKSI